MPRKNLFQRRFKGELAMMEKHTPEGFDYYVSEDNPYEWWILMKGLKDSSYEGGYYMFKVILPKEYPMKPPSYQILTPNGRFTSHISKSGKTQTSGKICLSNSSYHADMWKSVWYITTILKGFQSIWMDDREAGVGHIVIKNLKDKAEVEKFDKNRRKLAKESHQYNIEHFPKIYQKFKRFIGNKFKKLETDKTIKKDTTKNKQKVKKKILKKLDSESDVSDVESDSESNCSTDESDVESDDESDVETYVSTDDNSIDMDAID